MQEEEIDEVDVVLRVQRQCENYGRNRFGLIRLDILIGIRRRRSLELEGWREEETDEESDRTKRSEDKNRVCR